MGKAFNLSQLADAFVLPLGADPTGVADSTAAIQAALSSGALAVFLPPGTYKYSSLVMPTTFGFVLFGAGTATTLQQTGSGITWPSTGTGTPGYYEGYIRDLSFKATGTANGPTINTQYAGGVTLMNLYCGNMPVGFDFIKVDGNSASITDKYTHDVRIHNVQIYSNTAGRAGIYFTQYASDSWVRDFIMNGNSVVQYCWYMENGAQSINFANSHPYNAATNICLLAAGATTAIGMTFDNVIFDNVSTGTGDQVILNNASTPLFTGCWFQVTHSGRNSVTLTNVRGTTFSNCRWDGVAGSNYCINETGTSDYTIVMAGDCPSIGNFLNPNFNFIGSHSYATSFVAANQFGLFQPFTGSTTAGVAAASTVYLGCNAAQAAQNATGFMVAPISGVNVLRADIAWDVAPGAGTFTFTLLGNGSTMTAASGSANPVVVTGSVFSATIIIAQGAGAFLAQFNPVLIRLVTSAGAGVANFRYSIQCRG